MRGIDLRNVQEATDFDKIPAGGYICKIVNVTDDAQKGQLIIEFDIADGMYKGFYQKRFNDTGWDFLKKYQSYSNEKALPFFKSFITAVQESNKSFLYDDTATYFDETTLIGKFVGLVLGYEEYEASDGKVKTRLYVKETRSVDKIRKGDFKTPELKKLKSDATEFGNPFSMLDNRGGAYGSDTTNLPNNATQAKGYYNKTGSYTTGQQQRMDDMPEYDDGFKMINDDDLPF